MDGAKNAVLPILAACLLTDKEVNLAGVPELDDVRTMTGVLSELGVDIRAGRAGRLSIRAGSLTRVETPDDLAGRMRASFVILGPLLSRFGRANIPLPGGCSIGSRPIDLHLKGLEAMGAITAIERGYIRATVPSRLRGTRVYLDLPSVGATENIIMAAALAEGTTLLENAAEEPEVVDLANFLNAMGARITGAGTRALRIEGVESLHGADYAAIPDRIEAGTFMVAAAITGGDVQIRNVIAEHLKPVTAKLREAGARVQENGTWLRVTASDRPYPTDVKTLPYPGFPTDLQAPMMALLTLGMGTSVVTETVFENRFLHVAGLRRMGAGIVVEGRSAVIRGVEALSGAPVTAPDLRAGAALVLAGLAAAGETEVSGLHHIDRGYVRLDEKLAGLGADISRRGDS
jgi:UDP-N-acetylglucosamine 1-carboxyvinyltransferase